MREGGRALKFAHFEKGRMFGATYQRNVSRYAEFLTNLNTLSYALLRFQKLELSLF